MKKQRINKDRFNTLKLVLSGLEKTNTGRNKQGVTQVYKALNIASSTASYIMRSDTYEDYKEFIRKKSEKAKVPLLVTQNDDMWPMLADNSPFNTGSTTSPFDPEPLKSDSKVTIDILHDLNMKLDMLIEKVNKRRLF